MEEVSSIGIGLYLDEHWKERPDSEKKIALDTEKRYTCKQKSMPADYGSMGIFPDDWTEKTIFYGGVNYCGVQVRTTGSQI